MAQGPDMLDATAAMLTVGNAFLIGTQHREAFDSSQPDPVAESRYPTEGHMGIIDDLMEATINL